MKGWKQCELGMALNLKRGFDLPERDRIDGVYIADCKMIIGRGLAAINHKERCNSYLYYLLKSAFSEEDIIGNGAIFNAVGKDELTGFKFICPDMAVTKTFNDSANKLDQQIICIIRANDLLRRSRDMLLSRLMSCKLDVERLDIKFPASMMEEGKRAGYQISGL